MYVHILLRSTPDILIYNKSMFLLYGMCLSGVLPLSHYILTNNPDFGGMILWTGLQKGQLLQTLSKSGHFGVITEPSQG